MIRAALLLALLLACAGTASSAETLFNEQGLRASRYRAPLPDSVPHGQRVSAAQVRELIATKNLLLIDVQAVTVRPELADFGIAFLPNKTRWHIPGSHWLPNVGYGELDVTMQAYFRDNLARLTAGDFARPILFYCVADCWMSWNAVQRAHGYGYRELYWLSGGTEEWAAADGELVEGEPVPLETD